MTWQYQQQSRASFQASANILYLILRYEWIITSHTFQWDVIIHPCANCKLISDKILLKLRHGWVITYPNCIPITYQRPWLNAGLANLLLGKKETLGFIIIQAWQCSAILINNRNLSSHMYRNSFLYNHGNHNITVCMIVLFWFSIDYIYGDNTATCGIPSLCIPALKYAYFLVTTTITNNRAGLLNWQPTHAVVNTKCGDTN